MERGRRSRRSGRAGGRRARCPWQCAQRRRQRHRDEGPQGQGFVLGGQGRHQGQEHPPSGGHRRPQHRLQDRRHRRDEFGVGGRGGGGGRGRRGGRGGGGGGGRGARGGPGRGASP